MPDQSHFDKQLSKIIGAEEDVDAELEKLEDEEGEEEEQQKMLPDKVEYDKVPTHYNPEQQSDQFDDYQYARNVLYGLIERGTRALEGSMMVAGESEHPRAYEVTSTLMKNVSDMTKDLISLHEKFKPEDDGQPQVQNNTQINNYHNYGENKDDVNNVLDDLDDEENNNGD